MVPTLRVMTLVVLAAVIAAVAGCGESRKAAGRRDCLRLQRVALNRAARRAGERDAEGSHAAPRTLSGAWRQAAHPGAAASAVAVQPMRILSAPAEAAQPAESAARDEAAGSPVPPAAAGRWWQKPLAGRSFGEVVKDDLRLFPRELWKSTKDSATVPNLLILSAAGGLSAVSRGSWDHRVDRSFRTHEGSLFEKTGDFGSVAGSPLLHFGVALSAYGWGVGTGNDRLYAYSKSLTQALTVNGLVTVGLKLAANDHSPNGEDFAWPSGHTSSTATLAAVTWEHYGWQAGLPLYLLTGFVATSRLEDREHWLSDVIFGAVLGAVVGHSVARGRELEVGGFTVLPYVHPEGGAGLMFAKQF
jgi:membrane-associated phospholipid phosphatase